MNEAIINRYNSMIKDLQNEIKKLQTDSFVNSDSVTKTTIIRLIDISIILKYVLQRKYVDRDSPLNQISTTDKDSNGKPYLFEHYWMNNWGTDNPNFSSIFNITYYDHQRPNNSNQTAIVKESDPYYSNSYCRKESWDSSKMSLFQDNRNDGVEIRIHDHNWIGNYQKLWSGKTYTGVAHDCFWPVINLS